MIKYKCEFCSAKLETGDDMSGMLEACPVCQKGNTVPLSKHEQHELDKQRKEKRHQEHEQGKQRKAAAHSPPSPNPRKEAQQPRPIQAQAAKHKKKAPPTLTEISLIVAGGFCVAIGVLLAVVFFLTSNEVGGSAPIIWMRTVLILLGGFLSAIPFFAARLVLQYLRRIMNAAEGRK